MALPSIPCKPLTSSWGHSITTWTKRRVCWVNGKPTVGHVTKGRKYVIRPILSTRGGWGQNLVKFGPRSC